MLPWVGMWDFEGVEKEVEGKMRNEHELGEGWNAKKKKCRRAGVGRSRGRERKDKLEVVEKVGKGEMGGGQGS